MDWDRIDWSRTNWKQIAEVADGHAKSASQALRRKKGLAFFSGAGISMYRQSWLPGWWQLIESLLRAIAGDHPQAREECDYVLDEKNGFSGYLFNEMVLNLMKQTLGLPLTAAALVACLDTKKYSLSHRVLAWASEHYPTVSMLTANFDMLIEAAGGNNVEIEKLHGTLDDLEHARFTADSVFTPLEDKILRRTKELIDGRVLVVVGYGGEDEFDILPALLEGTPVPARVLWVVHSTEGEWNRGRRPTLSGSARHRLEALGSRAEAFPADTDVFLGSIYRNCCAADPGVIDAQLDDEKVAHRSNPKTWWRSKLGSWGRSVHRQEAHAARYLWARLLDQLRIYEVVGADRVRNYAEDAFGRFLGASPGNRAWVLDAKSRLAIMRRLTDRSDPDEFRAIQAEIDAELRTLVPVHGSARPASAGTGDGETVAELRRLRGLVVHQGAIALQSRGLRQNNRRDLEDALERITEAIDYRRGEADDLVCYSLFQRFILSTYMAERGHGTLDAIFPADDRDALCEELGDSAQRFLEGSNPQPEHCGNTRHNLAYVYQILGKIRAAAGKDGAARYFRRAIRWNEDGRQIRVRLRDPRMIAQSDVRIAQCKLSLADLEWGRNHLAGTLRLVIDAETVSHEISKIYQRTPQEGHRLKDLDDLWDWAERHYRQVLRALHAAPARKSTRLSMVQCLLGLTRIASGRSDVARRRLDILEKRLLRGALTRDEVASLDKEIDALTKLMRN